MPPLVSIAIRAYRRRWLTDAMASVLAQTRRDLELIVYDDAGDLEDVAASFPDSRVRYHRATGRFQASGRFNAAVALCRGRYIGLLDDDDRYEPDFVTRLVVALEQDPEAGIAFCRTTIECDGQRFTPVDHRRAGRQEKAAQAMLAERWTVSPSHMLIRREALEAARRDQPMPDGVSPDAWMNLRVSLAGWGHVLVDEPLMIYRWHDGQLSRSGLAAGGVSIATWEQLRIDDPELARLRDRLLARAYLVRGLDRLCAGDSGGAVEDVDAAGMRAPAAWPLARRLLRVAARLGPFGSCVTRAGVAWSPLGRQRNRPPRFIGDGATRRRS